MAIPEAPMQFIAIDIAFMPKGNHGFQYFLLIGDVFSKYIEAVPLKDQMAPTIANALLSHWIYIHGPIFYMLSDQGSNVDGTMIKEICNILGIEVLKTCCAQFYYSEKHNSPNRNPYCQSLCLP